MKSRYEGKNIVEKEYKNLKRRYDIDYCERNRKNFQIYKKNYY